MKKVLILFFILCVGILPTIARPQMDSSGSYITHYVDRGETLSFIAKKYGVSEEDIIKLNPDAAQFVYAGMELVIPVSSNNVITAPSGSNTYSENILPENGSGTYSETNQSSVFKIRESRSVEDFSSLYLFWLATYKKFDHGAYGVGYTHFFADGFGFDVGAAANYGVMDPGNLYFLFGPAYGYVIHPNVLVYGMVRGYMFTHKVLDMNLQQQTKVNGGILFAPAIRLSYKRFNVGAAFNFGWINKSDRLSATLQLSLGYEI